MRMDRSCVKEKPENSDENNFTRGFKRKTTIRKISTALNEQYQGRCFTVSPRYRLAFTNAKSRWNSYVRMFEIKGYDKKIMYVFKYINNHVFIFFFHFKLKNNFKIF